MHTIEKYPLEQTPFGIKKAIKTETPDDLSKLSDDELRRIASGG